MVNLDLLIDIKLTNESEMTRHDINQGPDNCMNCAFTRNSALKDDDDVTKNG